MRCLACKSALPEGAQFCPVCGRRAPKPEPKVLPEKKPEGGKLCYTVKEAARAIGVSAWLIYEEIKCGRLACVQLHGRKVVSRWALEGYVKAREVPARNGGVANAGLV